MKRILLVTAMLIAASAMALGQKDPRVQNRTATNDEEALKQSVREWADAAVHADLVKLGKFMDDKFGGFSDDNAFEKFDKKGLLAAIRSGNMKVAAWTIDDLKVSIRGNSASVTGRSKLANAIFMGKDYSGEYEWTDHFVKKDGIWRAVSSRSKRIKQ